MTTPPPAHSPVPLNSAEETCGPLAPAPYGRACAGCARAKCKCFMFYGHEGSDCERCHRLGKKCEPSTVVRKRKAPTGTVVTQPASAPPPAPPPSNNSRLEEKLDDLVTLLRAQAVDRANTSPVKHHHHHHGSSSPSSPSSKHDSSGNAMPGNGMATGSTSTSLSSADSPYNADPFRPQDPDLMISMDSHVVHYLRRSEEAPLGVPGPVSSSSIIFDDVAVHHIPEGVADESLDMFRRAFVTTFPFVHLPPSLGSAELLVRKPFLWLNIMALTTKMVARQFAMEETIWQIVSRRIVAQQHASLDLLLGVICFASWSHYFKQDKPFMTMLSQVAVSVAFELGIQKDVNRNSTPRNQSHGPSRQLRAEPPRPTVRTMEERRTILAVFHLTSSTWTAYRKTEPLRWTSYFDDCLGILAQGRETDLDLLLATQVKCQIITNSLTCPHFDSFEDEGSTLPPAVLMKAMLGRLNDIRQSLPALMRTERTTELYLYSTEITIQESFLHRPRPPPPQRQDPTGASHFRRLQDLQAILDSVARCLSLFLEMPPERWAGVSADTFSQLTHGLVVLFRLTTHAAADTPGWDPAEVRRRADVLEVLDRVCDAVGRVPAALGIVDVDDAGGSRRRGLFFKAKYLFRAIKTLFVREMGMGMVVDHEGSAGGVGVGDMMAFPPVTDASGSDVSMEGVGGSPEGLVDDFIVDLSYEPWLADLLAMGPSWSSGPEAFLYPPYTEY